MKLTKSLILSSAAMFAGGGAQAADLPVKAKAIEYVKVCTLYGAGFWYVPGTDTCIKLGGHLRASTTINGRNHNGPFWNGNGGQHNRYADRFTARSRMALTVDTRTATEYGVVRTFGQIDFDFDDPDNTASFSGFPFGSSVYMENLFIQFAGFTFGKSASAYATPWHGYPGNLSSSLLGGHDTVTGVNNIQYTAQFGNGVSGTIGLDSPMYYNRTQVYNLGSVGINVVGISPNAYANVHAPDIVGNIRVDQAWGLFQFSAAAHEVSGSYDTLTAGTAAPSALSEISGHPASKWGGSVMAALQVKNLPTGPGDDIKIDASYAVGTTKNVISTSGFSPSFAMFSGTSAAGAYQSIGLGATSDAIYLPAAFGGDGQLKLTKAWGIRGAFNHNWDPYWSTSLFGSYSAVRYDGAVGDLSTAKGAYCAAFAVTHPGQGATYTCDPSFNVAQLGVITRWTPVKNLSFAAELLWVHLDQKMSGTSLFGPGAPKPTATYEFKDQNTLSLLLNARRNF
ncbi:porin [Bradyrhizobium sp. CB3481]|uniref:porin n=1 Tax=Bradyrhizobium sp. CB3481 TaxID=3039158 RepID=UPI0024B17CD4|nr:porin [Bradyrhizobium sp. CB3481]WFU14567.1 porin [Bradyrhizobium sp. CB3481]